MSGPDYAASTDWRFGQLPLTIQNELENASPERLRRIAVACAEIALTEVRLDEPHLHLAIDRAKRGTTDDTDVAQVERVARRLDEAYLEMFDELKPEGRTSGYQVAFRMARGAASVGASLRSDPRDAAANAAYEAVHAIEPAALDGLATVVGRQ